ncbi:MAG: hypothetical protein IJH80_01725 [Ruminococcus sp.]|nr:hypothetical protein [Ruminococcus sp.]MBQ7071515.1 hypothetical protein [Ruminococcus sp.]
MLNINVGDTVKDAHGKTYNVIEVHEHNVLILEEGKEYWERICMGNFDFNAYFKEMSEEMPGGGEDIDEDEDEEDEEDY